MKKIVSLVLALSMVMSMFVSAFAATKTFEDVTDPACVGAVEALVELGVIDGLPDGTYGPEKDVTRAQLAKMLVICLGLGDSVDALAGRTVFTDVADSHWATGYINAAVQSKVIAGYPDGTFKPEKNVSYAEAVTMVIRALGYGNVVDTEGVWPTSYMLKAVELKLLNDMGSPKANETATRGNVAILLWNMLKTPMWKIYEESEGNGMTSTAREDVLMLNVKFPDYKYVEKSYIESITIVDQEVTVVLTNDDEAKVEGMDLPRLLIGMEVSALIKDYEEEDATFLTLTPANTIVEGVVTKESATKITIEDAEYRYEAPVAEADEEVSGEEVSGEEVEEASLLNSYVVAEVDGKKIVTLVTLPMSGVEVEKIKSMESKIKNEDALVIIDGEWATRADIEVGDVYTKFEDGVNGVIGEYYVVARERLEGTFESFTVENSDDEYAYVEIDGEEYRAIREILTAWEDEENDTEVEEDQLREVEKKNKYLDQEVEVVLNYLGQVMTIYFGEVSDLEAEGNFYVVTSNGVWRESTSKGEVLHILLVGADGEENAYTFAKGVTMDDLAEVLDGGVYEAASGDDGEATFVYVKFNDDGEIKKIYVLPEVDASGDYVVEEFATAMDDSDCLGTSGNKVIDSTVVFTAIPVEDDDVIIGFDVEVSEGKEALNKVEKGMFAYDDTTISKRVKYVFVSDDARSNFNYGLVESTRERKGTFYATISGTEYKLDTEALAKALEISEDELVYEVDVTPLVGKLVAFTELNEKVSIDVALEPSDIDTGAAATVTKVEDGVVVVDKDIPVDGTIEAPTLGTALDTTLEEVEDLYKKFTFLKASAYVDGENNVKFEDDYEEVGTGIEGVTAKKGDRLVYDLENKLVVIVSVSGADADDTITDGKLVIAE